MTGGAILAQRSGTEVEVTATPIAIPYEPPLRLANGTVAEHCAVIVEIANGAHHGYGEIALGPGTSRAEATVIASRVALLGEEISRSLEALDACRPVCDAIPRDLRPGIEAAGLDCIARVRGENLSRTLGDHSNEPAAVRVNAMIDRNAPHSARLAVDRAVADGYRCLKLKVGADSLDGCLETLAYVREHHGKEVALRIDCNGAWSVDEARTALQQLEPFLIEYVEQPVGTVEELRALRTTTSISIAADESACNLESIEKAIDLGAVDLLVLKPARLGLKNSLSAAERARSAGIDCVVTSNLETSLGVGSALHVAAIVDASQPGRSRAHGLGTVGFLSGDLVEPRLLPRNGTLTRSISAGSGPIPSTAEIERWKI